MIREVNADPAREESYLENANIADHGSNRAVGLGIRIVLVLGSFGGEVELALEMGCGRFTSGRMRIISSR
jgi:hypothetical protein